MQLPCEGLGDREGEIFRATAVPLRQEWVLWGSTGCAGVVLWHDGLDRLLLITAFGLFFLELDEGLVLLLCAEGASGWWFRFIEREGKYLGARLLSSAVRDSSMIFHHSSPSALSLKDT